ncbi:MAG: hypothetical protein DCC88_11740 [Spirobacillus cienkowskii]|jgi:hypothetical protein|uniref:Uncharacterized protein n=1 Tax=Spirobacillus cienkowskii TaxID=495820 RepID=A0A369KR06_9BACT|nr:MAG: hypothetical protein DCC88_11740 [Spirobacillus cienkowskii]
MCFLCFEKFICWEWNTVWTAFAAIGTVGSFLLLIIPKISSCCNKRKKIKRLHKFFHDLQANGWPKYYKSNYGLEWLNTINFKETNPNNNDSKSLLFFKYQNIFYNDKENLFINNILIPQGYNFFKITDKNLITLIIINDATGEKLCAYIYRDNNIYNSTDNNRKFDTIISWK